MRDSSTTSSTRPRVRRTSSAGASATRCDSEPAPAQTVAVPEQRPLDEDDGTRSSGNGDDGSRTEPRRRHDLVGLARSPPVARSTSRATFPVSTLRSPGTSATTGDAVAHEDDRLHDLAERAAHGVGGRLRGRASAWAAPRSAPPRRSPAGTPRRAPPARATPCRLLGHPSSTKRTSSKPTAWSWSTSSVVAGGVDREDHQRLASLLRPRDGHVRDVDAGVAEHGADAADHPRLVGVADEDHVRRDLEVDPEAERAAEEEPRLGPDRRARRR